MYSTLAQEFSKEKVFCSSIIPLTHTLLYLNDVVESFSLPNLPDNLYKPKMSQAPRTKRLFVRYDLIGRSSRQCPIERLYVVRKLICENGRHSEVLQFYLDSLYINTNFRQNSPPRTKGIVTSFIVVTREAVSGAGMYVNARNSFELTCDVMS